MKQLSSIFTLSFFLCACTSPLSGPTETFTAFIETIEARYGGIDARNIDWPQLQDSYLPLVDDNTTDDELFNTMCELLTVFDDGHVSLMAPNQPVCKSNRYYREKIGFDLFDLDLIRDDYLAGDWETNDWKGHTLGQLDDGTPYLHLAGTSDNLPILADVRPMAEANNGFLLDMRHNGGGQFTYAFNALSDWRSDTVPVHQVRTRNGPELHDYTDWFTWELEGNGTDINFPIVVLIDRFTISAGERMLLALNTFDNITFIGDYSNGAFATTTGTQLPNRWYFVLPSQELRLPNGTTPEGIGFEPDIFIQNDPTILDSGLDQVLEEGLRLLNTMR